MNCFPIHVVYLCIHSTASLACLLAEMSQTAFRGRLKHVTPADPDLRSLLEKMVGSGQLWNDLSSNEDTYLEARLGPFLESYFSDIKFQVKRSIFFIEYAPL